MPLSPGTPKAPGTDSLAPLNIHLEGPITPDEEAKIKARAQTAFEEQSHPDIEELRRLERPKTPEELQIIATLNHQSNLFLKHYGAEPVDIPRRRCIFFMVRKS